MNNHFDIGIIGGGPGGYNAAFAAIENGMSVVLFEMLDLGGVCLNEGCIPIKSLLNSSKKNKAIDETLYDGENRFLEVDWLLQKTTQDVDSLKKALTYRLKQCGVVVENKKAVLIDETENKVVIESQNEKYYFNYLIVATGSHNIIPNIKGLLQEKEKGFVGNHKDAIGNICKYKKIAVIGGGVIGLELASIYANMGCDVEIFELSDVILPKLDAEIRNEYIRILKKNNVTINTDTKIEELYSENNKVVLLSNLGKSKEYDYCIYAIGRQANLDFASEDVLDRLGIEYNNGFIAVNEEYRTGNNKIYAVGDVVNKSMLAYTANAEARVAVNSICNKTSSKIQYHLIPRVVYSNPEIAYIGFNERDCEKKGLTYLKKVCSMNYSSMYMIENGKKGGKIELIIDESSDSIVGCQIVGNGAAELISLFQIIMVGNMKLNEIKNIPFVHPSITEVLFEILHI